MAEQVSKIRPDPIITNLASIDRDSQIFIRGASPPRTPLHALSRAASPARSVRVARFAALARVVLRAAFSRRIPDSIAILKYLSGGLSPGGPPARFAALARVVFRAALSRRIPNMVRSPDSTSGTAALI